MNCIEHDDRNAVAQCVQCGVGICRECESNSIFRINNQALCGKCNFNIACENDRIFKSTYNTKQMVMIVNVIAFSVGLLGFFIGGNNFVFLFICWFIGGLIANIALRQGIKSFKERTSFFMKIAGFIGELIGMALACPIVIISNLIGMLRVKKQIKDNDAILSRFGVGNNQSSEAETLFEKGWEAYNNKNYDIAAGYIRKAADLGDAEAQNLLGIFYNEGKGVKQDDNKSVEWLRKAVDQGNAAAQDNLGFCYLDGIGIQKDSVKAAELFRKAAEQGNANGQKKSGCLLF